MEIWIEEALEEAFGEAFFAPGGADLADLVSPTPERYLGYVAPLRAPRHCAIPVIPHLVVV